MNQIFSRPFVVRVSAVAVALTLSATACRSRPQGAPTHKPDQFELQLLSEFARQPDSLPARWLGLIGEYGPDTTTRWYALERDRRMYILDQFGNYVPLTETSDTVFQS